MLRRKKEEARLCVVRTARENKKQKYPYATTFTYVLERRKAKEKPTRINTSKRHRDKSIDEEQNEERKNGQKTESKQQRN